MTNSLDSAIAEAIRATQGGVAKAVDFTLDQAPEVIQQFLVWKFWPTFMNLIILTIMTIILLFFSRISYKQVKDGNNGWIPGVVMPIFFSIFTVGFLFSAAAKLVQIKVAPKVYLIEYILKKN